MGVHLHEVIKETRNGIVYYHKEAKETFSFDDPEQRNLANYVLKKNITKAVCFDLGSFDDWPHGLKMDFNCVELPYEVCWFEASGYDGLKRIIVGALIWETKDSPLSMSWPTNADEKTYSFMFFLRDSNSWFFCGRSLGKGHRAVGDEKNMPYLFPYVYQPFLSSFTVFFKCLECTNVTLIKHQPPKRRQHKKKFRNRLPLFEYWTLNLKVPKNESNEHAPGCGLYRSPRVHLRRGHRREYQPGKYCWVQPCVVGKKKNGFIHKDYMVQPRKDMLVEVGV